MHQARRCPWSRQQCIPKCVQLWSLHQPPPDLIQEAQAKMWLLWAKLQQMVQLVVLQSLVLARVLNARSQDIGLGIVHFDNGPATLW